MGCSLKNNVQVNQSNVPSGESIVPVEKSSTTSVGTVSNQVKSNLQYSLDLTYSKSMMKFLIINNSSKNIELIFPNTHTFNFILTKDGNVIFDNYKDNPNVVKLNWETHQLLKANGDINYVGQGYDIWYETLTKKVKDGIYNFEFYSTSKMLKDVPHLKGQLEIKDGNINVIGCSSISEPLSTTTVPTLNPKLEATVANDARVDPLDLKNGKLGTQEELKLFLNFISNLKYQDVDYLVANAYPTMLVGSKTLTTEEILKLLDMTKNIKAFVLTKMESSDAHDCCGPGRDKTIKTNRA